MVSVFRLISSLFLPAITAKTSAINVLCLIEQYIGIIPIRFLRNHLPHWGRLCKVKTSTVFTVEVFA